MRAPVPRPGRVTVVGSGAWSLVHFRGPLLRELRRRGWQVRALAPRMSDEIREQLTALGVDARALNLHRRRLASLSDLRVLLVLWSEVRQARAGDVLVPYTIKPIVLAALAHRLGRSKASLVPMFTGLGVLLRLGGGRRERGALAALRWALARTDRVVVQHDGDRDWIRVHRLVPSAVPIGIVPGSGVDIDHFQPRPFDPHPPAELLFLGRMVPEKGIVAFGRYAAAAPWDARFVAVGSFEDRQTREQVLPGLVAAGVEHRDRVRDVRPALASARVVVLPTIYGEGIPRVVLEAMACGRPVVVSDAPGCRAAVRDGVEGFVVDPADDRRVLEVLGRLVEDPELAARMGAAGRRRAEGAFASSAVATLTADAVLDGAQPRRSRM